ncbi:hypothetical protein ACOYW6_01725 [Parablastomonas sp. CN1-191]|uniref:hypothetical protein n=1 Tax=Parablastomonas sp. CN1-191 TaxID=3400908 RepID=UPI003BF77928
MSPPRLLLPIAVFAIMAPFSAQARDALGTFAGWAAFRDPQVPRCYAIARAEPAARRDPQVAYVDVSTWPRRALFGQVHFRLARPLAPGARPQLAFGGQRAVLTADGAGNAWAADPRADAAIVAALRGGARLTVWARDAGGKGFVSTFAPAGAPSALDAMALACARR